MYTFPTFSAIVIGACPFQLLSSLSRPSFNRGHSRFCHTHSRLNGLQSAPKYLICIHFPLQRGSASQAPFHSPQNPTRIKQETGAAFLTNVHATFLCRHETTLGKYSASPQSFSSEGNKGVATLENYKPRSSGRHLET